jgi:hypothetical protein
MCRVFCLIRGAISEVSATAHGILWQTCESPNGWKFHPHPPSPHPRRRRTISPAQLDLATATARLRRRAVDPPTRCRSASPTPPPTSFERSTALFRAGTGIAAATDGYKVRASARSGATLLLPAPRSTGDHVLLEPTFNMAHPRFSPKCSQGMRLYRPPTNFARNFCLKLVVVKSFYMHVCRVHRTMSTI